MAQMIFYQSYDPPKISMLFPKKNLKIETAVVAVYYIKTASGWLKSCSARIMTPLNINMLFPKMFLKN